ncbi:MAG: trehalase family glycosidase [Salegentibacter sp.]
MEDKDLYAKVREILKENRVTGYSKSQDTHFTYIKPSKNFYRFQFFWDTCFHIFILCSLGETDIAKKCLRSQFAMQDDDGFVGHVHYWNNVLPSRITDIFQTRPSLGINLVRSHMSALIQPPLVAQALQRIYKKTGDKEYLKEMLPKVKKYFDWIARNRDYDGDGLITIISPFESGMDWKPTYDPVVGFPRKKADWRLFWKVIEVDFMNFIRDYDNEKMRKHDKFRVKDAGFNTFYIKNLKVVADLCDEAGDEDAGRYRELMKKVRKSLVDVMFDEEDEAFYDVQGKENKKIRILTPTIFFPVVLDNLPDEIQKKVMDRHFFNKDEFHTKFPIPSLAINDPAFNPDHSMYIWRGPTWIVNNWFMYQFFLEKGYNDEARHLIAGIKNLIDESGFREYFNPFNGEGHGAKNFTWAGLVVDMMEMEKGNV